MSARLRDHLADVQSHAEEANATARHILALLETARVTTTGNADDEPSAVEGETSSAEASPR